MPLYRATANGNEELPQAEADAITAEWAANDNLAVYKGKLKRRITEKRLEVEAQGVTVNGVPVNTTEYGQSRLSRAFSFVGRAQRNIDFKDATGVYHDLTVAQVQACFDAAGDHVQACYAAEKAHYAAVDALTTKPEVLAYDYSTGWPVS